MRCNHLERAGGVGKERARTSSDRSVKSAAPTIHLPRSREERDLPKLLERMLLADTSVIAAPGFCLAQRGGIAARASTKDEVQKSRGPSHIFMRFIPQTWRSHGSEVDDPQFLLAAAEDWNVDWAGLHRYPTKWRSLPNVSGGP